MPDTRPLRIAVIGRNGQLARSLADVGAARPEIEVISIGRAQVDLAKPGDLAPALAAIQPELVINTAAYTAVDKAEAEPEEAFRINRDGAAAVARACADQHVPLIHISTDYVFDGTGSVPYRETDPCNPQGVYGRSKLDGEQRVLAQHPDAIVLRTAWLHSPYGTNFVRTMLRLAGERDELRVVADQRGSPTYAPDLADALLTMAQRRIATPAAAMKGVFHLAGSGQGSWWEVAKAIMSETQSLGSRSVPVHPITTAEYPTPARRPAWSVLDTTKATTIFGVTLPPWRDGLRRGVTALLSGLR